MYISQLCLCVFEIYAHTNCNLIKNNLCSYYYMVDKHKMRFVVNGTKHFNAYFYTFRNVFRFCVVSRVFTTYIWSAFKGEKNIGLRFF